MQQTDQFIALTSKRAYKVHIRPFFCFNPHYDPGENNVSGFNFKLNTHLVMFDNHDIEKGKNVLI